MDGIAMEQGKATSRMRLRLRRLPSVSGNWKRGKGGSPSSARISMPASSSLPGLRTIRRSGLGSCRNTSRSIPSPRSRKPTSAAKTGDFDNFFQPLANYGSWFNTSDYGYVFQPTRIVHDTSWRPYTRGRWAFTDLGWTWVSDEPFGWATYHYGRWALLRNAGWVWVPSNQQPLGSRGGKVPDMSAGRRFLRKPSPITTAQSDPSVEVTFGIGSRFSFVSYRDFGSPVPGTACRWRGTRALFRISTNITHYRVDKRRVFLGGHAAAGGFVDEIGRKFPVVRPDI